MGWKKASKQFNVPKTTFMRLANVKYVTPKEASKVKRGRPPVLSKDIEDELVTYCLAMEVSSFGLTHADFRRIAVQLAERNQTHTHLKMKWQGKMVTSFFYKGKSPHYQKGSRPVLLIAGISVLAKYLIFSILDEVYEKRKFTPDKIYNVDESGITVVQSKVAKVFGLRGKGR